MHLILLNIDRSTKFFVSPVLIGFLLLLTNSAVSQEKKRIDILQAGSLIQSENIANARRLIDDVIIQHEDLLMYCDSAYTYENTNRVDAFGNVHVNQGDTLHLYAAKIYYDGDRSFAQAISEVVLQNKQVTLYTDTLDYDLDQKIGYYDCGGKIVDSTNTLTSKLGKYYLDQDLAHFTDSVVGFSKDYTLSSENLQYNTTTKVVFFKGPTTIQDSTNTLYAEDGWYNTETGAADLQKTPSISNKDQLIRAQKLLYDKETGDGQASGDVYIEDFKNRSIVRGNKVIYNDKTKLATVSDSAMFVSYSDTDSLYLHADTLRTLPDTVQDEKIIKAYYGVRFYRNDVQGICDSLLYFTKDSLAQLFYSPVLWSESHQLTADQIDLLQHRDSPDELHLFKNSFIISELDTSRYDQIKGKNMTGYVIDNELNYIDVDGNGQTLYYARENNSIIGINRAESSNITIRFKEGKIYRIIFDKQPEGELKPLLNMGENDKFLSDFNWYGNKRPISKDDIFRNPDAIKTVTIPTPVLESVEQ